MELPAISRMNAFMRWFIYRGMRSGIENPVSRTHHHLHLDKEPFKKELGIEGEEEIVVVLVNDKERCAGNPPVDGRKPRPMPC